MTEIKIMKPRMRWLFSGLGFHNSEASMTALMNEDFLNQRVLKTFSEISPTFSRVYAGYADWTKEAMDSFVEYYNKTFKAAGTVLYIVPGRMPMIGKDFDIKGYCEKVASNLEYLINEKGCDLIRYYCVTNELSCGNTYAYLAKHLDLLKELHEELDSAFKRHGLDIGLLATDCSGVQNFDQIGWATENMDEITDAYCAHLYCHQYTPGDPEAYSFLYNAFSGPVALAAKKEKRFILGEFGITYRDKWNNGLPMGNDSAYVVDFPEDAGNYAIALAEMSIACINSGCLAGVFWTMFDYPDPMLKEKASSGKERLIYDAMRFSGHGMSYRYNKNGLIKWCDDEKDYSSRSSLYTMGYMAKLFRKGSRVLKCEWCDESIRCAAVTNSDGSVSIAIVNWSDEPKETVITLEHNCEKPLREYIFESEHIPYNDFCDLQSFSELIYQKNNEIKLSLKGRSVTFLTTDYIDRIPSKIKGIKLRKNILSWQKCFDTEHCYYRVFASDKRDFKICYENQIASTFDTNLTIKNKDLYYKVISVDKWGNHI